MCEGTFNIFYISLFVPSCFTSSNWIYYLQAEWVALNYVPFAERSLEVVVDLYHKTACHKAVINEKVLQNIIKVSNTAHLTFGGEYCNSIVNGLSSPTSKHGGIFSRLFV